MSGTRRPPNLLVPAGATVVAMLDFVVCFMMPGDSPSRYGMVWMVVGLIALAITQWVLYFHQYVDFRIDQAMCEPNVSTQPDAGV
jgi:hypothetical protein